jgi:Tol biopolymer transport system component
MKNVPKISYVLVVVLACISFCWTGESGALPTGTYQQLTTGANYCWHGDFSPTGPWVVYQKAKSGSSYGNIWKIRTDGTDDTQLTHGYYCDSSPQFSPDGKKIAFQRNINPEGSSVLDHGASIWVMNADGTNPRQLVAPQIAYIGGAQTPMWSPDGKYIAYRYGEGSSASGVWVVRSNGSQAPIQVVTTDFGSAPGKYMDWAPNIPSKKMAVSVRVGDRSSPPYSRQIAVVKFDPTGAVPVKRKWVTESDPTGVNSKTCQWNMRWNSDGTTLVYTDDYNNYSDIWKMNPDGTHKVRLTDSATNGNACYVSPQWSPDGNFIAYWSNEGLSNWYTRRIYVMTPDGTRKKCVMDNEALGHSSYSSDFLHFNKKGDKLLFTGYDASNIVQLWIVNLQ